MASSASSAVPAETALASGNGPGRAAAPKSLGVQCSSPEIVKGKDKGKGRVRRSRSDFGRVLKKLDAENSLQPGGGARGSAVQITPSGQGVAASAGQPPPMRRTESGLAATLDVNSDQRMLRRLESRPAMARNEDEDGEEGGIDGLASGAPSTAVLLAGA